MKQRAFEAAYADEWQTFAGLLDALEQPRPQVEPADYAQFTHRYRRVCHLQALARERRYSSYLVEQLQDLVRRGHQQLYRRRPRRGGALVGFLVRGFPALVRAEARLFWLASALLYLPALGYVLAIQVAPDLVYNLMPPGQVTRFEQMYDPANRVLGEARESATNLAMFGFYIQNNISVAFRTFATGIAGGLGTLFFLLFNGLLFGAVAGHLTVLGYTQTFFPFVVGHGSFELTAIVIAGMAGLKLGHSLIAPGNRTRLESLKAASRVAIRLIYGVILMLLIAAFIEAFWSSNGALAPGLKYTVGAGLWLLVAAYLGLSGRSRSARAGGRHGA